jgi:hypothetical protein
MQFITKVTMAASRRCFATASAWSVFRTSYTEPTTENRAGKIVMKWITMEYISSGLDGVQAGLLWFLAAFPLLGLGKNL